MGGYRQTNRLKNARQSQCVQNQTGTVTESGVYTGDVRKALLERGHFTSRLKEKSTFVLYLIYAHYGVIIKVF